MPVACFHVCRTLWYSDIPACDYRLDEHGRSVQLVELDSKLFENHILPYLVTKRPGKLPPFTNDPEQWRL